MIVRNSMIAKILRVNGIVLYPFIFVAPRDPDVFLLNHEMIHWTQIQRHGVFAFYFLYLKEYFLLRRKGLAHDEAYRGISFEKEAYAHQNDLNYLERIIS